MHATCSKPGFLTLLMAACLALLPGAQAAPPGGQERILFIVASSKVHGASDIPASVSFGEVVHAWDTFQAAGYAVDFVSPDGGDVPLLDAYVSDEVEARLEDKRIMDGLRNTARPAEIDPDRYRAVYYVGGSNAMYGVAENPGLQAIAMHVYEKNGGVVSAVCHGTAGIVNLKLANGQYLISGRRISGYPEEHEDQDAPYFKHFPFLIRKTVEARGGTFHAVEGYAPLVEVDGRVVTGQNYDSTKPVAEAVVAVLASLERQPEPAPSGSASDADRQAVDRVMQKFLSAYLTADNRAASEVFRKDGVMIGYSPARGPALLSRNGEQFAEGFNGKPAADEAQRKRSYEIVDMAENLAAVRVMLDYPGWRGVDYVVLLKTDGKWMIASKTWTGVLTGS